MAGKAGDKMPQVTFSGGGMMWLFKHDAINVTLDNHALLAIGQGCRRAISSAVHRKRPSMKRERPSSTGQPGCFEKIL